MQIIQDIPDIVVSEDDVHHLAVFFSSRLNDWPCLHGALSGCHALLQLRYRASSKFHVSVEDAMAMANPLVKTIFVRSLSAKNRLLVMAVFAALVQHAGQAMIDADLDLLEFLVSSIDGEKDPRCLLKDFGTVRLVLELYHQQPESSVSRKVLDDTVDEVFEVLSCYFPISFTPPPDDPYGITRDKLADELKMTFVSEPSFAPMIFSLSLEKLSSSLKQAKIDSLNLIGAAAENFDAFNHLSKSFSRLWNNGLRPEFLSFVVNEADSASRTSFIALKADPEVCMAVIECLQKCLKSLSSDNHHGVNIIQTILEDSLIGDMITCVNGPGSGDPAIFLRSMERVRAATIVLAAFARASDDTVKLLSEKIILPLLEIVSRSPGQAISRALGWRALSLLLEEIFRSGLSIDADIISVLISTCCEPFLQKMQIVHAQDKIEETPRDTSSDMGSSYGAAELQSSPDEAKYFECVASRSERSNEDGAAPCSSSSSSCSIVDAPWPFSSACCSESVLNHLQICAMSSIAWSVAKLNTALEAKDFRTLLLALREISTRPEDAHDEIINEALQGFYALGLASARSSGSEHAAIFQEVLSPLLHQATSLQEDGRATRSSALHVLSRVRKADQRIQREIIMAVDGAIQDNMMAAVRNPEDSSAAILVVEMLQCVREILMDPYDAATESVRESGSLVLTWDFEHSGDDEVGKTRDAFDVLTRHLFTTLQHVAGMDDAVTASNPPKKRGDSRFIESAHQEFYYSIAEVMFLALNRASPGTQKDLLVPLIPSMDQALQTSQRDGYQNSRLDASICGYSGMLAAMQSDIIVERINSDQDSMIAFLTNLLRHSLGMYPRDGLMASVLVNAMASILNKVHILSNKDEIVKSVLNYVSFPRDDVGRRHDVETLVTDGSMLIAGEIGHALAMTGSVFSDNMAKRVIEWLLTQDGDSISGDGDQTSVQSLQAGEFLASLMGKGTVLDPLGRREGLKRWTEATMIARPLWLQRTYTIVTKGLENALEAESKYAEAERTSKQKKIFFALGYVIAAASPAILRNDMKRILPLIGQSIPIVMDFTGAWKDESSLENIYQHSTKPVLERLVEALDDILASELGRSTALTALDVLLPTLLAACRYEKSMQIRYHGFSCLIHMSKLPYHELHPYRRTVVRASSEGCDDNKRRVRLQAVRCRESWTSV